MNPRVVFVLFAASAVAAVAGTTIDSANQYAYGGNIGWVDCRGDTANGAVIGEYVCSGYLYSANVGWINLGSGTPTNGIYYQNLSADDFGVNQDGLGNLRGYAYGANIGWINFENIGAPKVDLASGQMSGFAWSANCGWISLSNAVAVVQTDSIQQGALAPDGLPSAWLLRYFGTTNVAANADADGDGASNSQEYLAGTDPTDNSDYLAITAFGKSFLNYAITWKSVSTRYYLIQTTLSLSPTGWHDSGLGLIPSSGLSTARGLMDTNAPERYYRIQAVRPLMP